MEPHPSADDGTSPFAPASRPYSVAGIVIAGFLGSPTAAGFLLRANYKLLGLDREASLSLWLSVAATIGLLALAWFLPENIPAMAFIVPQIVATGFVARKLMDGPLSEHRAAGGVTRSLWVAGAIGLGTGVAVLGLFICSVVLWDMFMQGA